jgi:GH18 family chitinase
MAEMNPRVVAYVPNWIDLKKFSEQIDYSRLSHINIAFENPVNAQGDLSFHTQDTNIMARARGVGVKVLVSIGGGSASTDITMKERYWRLISSTNVDGFVSKISDYVMTHDFDGVDVDLEGPAINEDYGRFIDLLSQNLRPKGKSVTAALSAGYGGDKVRKEVFESLDFVNIMAYDGSGPWNTNKPGPHSSMDFARSNVKYWLDKGLLREKAVLGVPFYGYGFGSSFRNWAYSFAEIVKTFPGAENRDQSGDVIWYNGIPTIKNKAQYTLDEQLGGMMIWSLDNDGAGENSLLKAMTDVLRKKQEGNPKPLFRVLAFYTGKQDQAHISFDKEANQWFSNTARENGFSYESTTDWTRLNSEVLSNIQVVVFLDTRPEAQEQRQAFEDYMKRGGAWLGFHFAAFALTPSAVPQNWDWYHQEFLGTGAYAGNTWRPTSAILRAENRSHPVMKDMPETFKASPNEWYKWENDLRKNPDIQILYSIDPASFPLGTGPKAHEIWHAGDYPMVWTHKKYRMVYVNMGHNDIDYENKTNRELSSTFSSPDQNHLILNCLLWLGTVH